MTWQEVEDLQDEEVRDGASTSKRGDNERKTKWNGYSSGGRGYRCPFMSDPGRLRAVDSITLLSYGKGERSRAARIQPGPEVPLEIEEETLGQGPPKGHGVAPSSSVDEGGEIGDSRAVQRLHDGQGGRKCLTGGVRATNKENGRC